MSRIGKRPVTVPSGVTAEIDGQTVRVKGPKGELSRTVHAEMIVKMENGTITVARPSEETRHKALHGLTRTLIANMVDGGECLSSAGDHVVGYKAESPMACSTGGGLFHPCSKRRRPDISRW